MSAAGQRRLLFTGNVKTSNNNKYRPGSGVGSLFYSTTHNNNYIIIIIYIYIWINPFIQVHIIHYSFNL